MSNYNIVSQMVQPVKSRCKDLLGTGWEPSEIEQAIRQAVLGYSRHKSRDVVADITGDGGFDYAINSTNTPGYVIGFSFVSDIEYPYDSSVANPQFIERDDWMIYNDAIRFLTAVPTSAQTIRVHYSKPRLDDADGLVDILEGTVAVLVDTDFFVVCDFSASKMLRHIASQMIGSGDSTLQSDVVNYRTKSGEAIRLADTLEKSYYKHLGIDPDSDDGGAVVGASVDVDFDTQFSFGADHLTHPARRN